MSILFLRLPTQRKVPRFLDSQYLLVCIVFDFRSARKLFGRASKRRMDAQMVVVVYGLVDFSRQLAQRSKTVKIPNIDIPISIKRFLKPILPGRALFRH